MESSLFTRRGDIYTPRGTLGNQELVYFTNQIPEKKIVILSNKSSL